MTPDGWDPRGRVSECRDQLFDALQRPRGWHRWPRNPELVRVWGQLKEDLDSLERILRESGTDAGATELAPGWEESLRFLERCWPDRGRWTLAVARELRYSTRAALVALGSRRYVGAQLESRKVADRWGKVLDPSSLTELRARYRAGTVDDAEHRRAVDGLALLAAHRSRDRRKKHARLALRGRYLSMTLAVLVVTIGTTALAVNVAGPGVSWAHLGVALGAGGLGATLSGIRDLRVLDRLSELRSFGIALATVPAVGAAAGLLVLLLLESSVLALPGTGANRSSAAATGLYAFVAGFSEPFLLGVVARLTGEKAPASQP